MTSGINAKSAFPEIALTLSGGGYRAAAFHLGAIDCLRRLGLLDGVTMLSTVSGGTITGMMYAVDMTKGQSYEDYYAHLYNLLLKTDVMQKALDNLYTVPGADTTLSLIRSAAQVYADDIFGNQTLALFYSPQQTRFRELIFNATEFRTGNSFRFQKSRNINAVIGNRLVPVDRRVAEETRLADILAASSCFPGAFEPIRFPDDFRWLAGNDLDAIRDMLGADFRDKNGQPISVPLMDGGIYDNQGLEGILLVSRRADADISLIIVSDTNQRADAIYQSPNQENRGRLTLKAVAWILVVLLCLSVLTAGTLLGHFLSTVRDSGLSLLSFIARHPSDFVYLYLIPFLLSSAVVVLLIGGYGVLKRKQKITIGGATFELWPVVRRLTIPDLLTFLQIRFESLMAMASTIFMKRIRALTLSRVMSDKDLDKRVMINVLYELNLNHPKLLARDPETAPSAALKELATRAEAVETKLWVTNQQELNDLIACGQATTCFNIMKFLWESRTAEMEAKTPPIYTLYQNALQLWKELKADPTKYIEQPPPPPNAP
ncbi:MAG: patatin-like phospholipase family protein [Pyrinomonadaceae bacterium]|nr:patatin-like phospholipase family protein [Pyrinomonadaceae bacterium]